MEELKQQLITMINRIRERKGLLPITELIIK